MNCPRDKLAVKSHFPAVQSDVVPTSLHFFARTDRALKSTLSSRLPPRPCETSQRADIKHLYSPLFFHKVFSTPLFTERLTEGSRFVREEICSLSNYVLMPTRGFYDSMSLFTSDSPVSHFPANMVRITGSRGGDRVVKPPLLSQEAIFANFLSQSVAVGEK